MTNTGGRRFHAKWLNEVSSLPRAGVVYNKGGGEMVVPVEE
jgi:hypothetical protein